MNNRNWLPKVWAGKVWAGIVVCCLAALIGVGLSGPTYHDEGLTLIELAGHVASPWPAGVTLASTLRDEMLESKAPFQKVVAELDRNEAHPPLYYAVLWLIPRLSGVGRLAEYRLFSVVMSVITLFVFAKWTKSLLCFTLLALSAQEVAFATFARDYILVVLLILTTACLMDSELRVPDWVRCAAGLVGGLAVWTHYLAIFPIAIVLLWSLFLYWNSIRACVLWAILLFAASSAPALWLAAVKMHTATHTVFPGLFTEASRILHAFLKAPSDPFFLLPGFLSKLAAAIVILSVLFVAITYRRRSRRAQLALLVVAAQTVVLLILARAAHQDFSAPRYMGLLLPFYCVLIAEALSGTGLFRRSMMALYVALIITGSCLSAAQVLEINSNKRNVMRENPSAVLIVWSKSPGSPAAILNDLPDGMSLYVLQSGESIQRAINWNPAINGKALFCPIADVPRSDAYDALHSHFSAKLPLFLSQFDCYSWTG